MRDRAKSLTLALATLVLASPATARADQHLVTVEPVAKYTRLSDEARLSRWAYTNLALKVRRAPSARARVVARLRFNTEDGPPELYLALRSYDDGGGNQWVEVRLPKRPNGTTGWVPREALGEFHRVTTSLIVNRRTLTATLFRSGRRIFRTRVGVGKDSTPTPAGNFYIRERLKGFGNPVYGPLAFGTSAYSRLSEWPGGGVIGIHGTNQPELIPGRPSHGCIRMRNSAILRLARLMPIGTPVRVI